ncbi:MAG: hypothetical protein GY895_21470 [Phycisphaera sp.]|nr:hypothetical protein [Phycisphaera sp.]
MTPPASRSGHGASSATACGVDLLSRRDHFVNELARRIEEAGFPREEAEEAIENLRTEGLLDDDRLARHRIECWRMEGRSEAECRVRLAARNVPSTTIDDAIRATATSEDGTDESGPADREIAAAIKTLQKALRSGGRAPSTERLAARLGRRGFEPDTIRAAMRHCNLPDPTSEFPPGKNDP